MAALSDKITDTRNAARPNTARVSSGRSAGGATLACDNLTGWPTASKVHFVTYTIDSNSNPVNGTQLDCEGIVSGNNIGSFTVLDGTDSGNAVNDVVEMLPTASWGQDLSDALMEEHNRDGTHAAVTADSVSSNTIAEGTAGSGVTVDGLNIKDGALTTAASVSSENLNATIACRAYHSGAQATDDGVTTKVLLDAVDFDLGSDFSIANSRFVAPVTGYYQITASAMFNNLNAAGDIVVVYIYVNGSEYSQGKSINAIAGGDPIATTSTIAPVTAGQFIELYAMQDSATTEAINTARTVTYLSIQFIGT